MFIVNQNGDAIVNIDNVESIDMCIDLDGTGKLPYKIYYETCTKREELGTYNSEKIAKAVLAEIFNACTDALVIGYEMPPEGEERGRICTKLF